jgi:hypothetical protein
MMRIVIEIDGDNVQVHTDRRPHEAEAANIIDAGSAPMDLLRQHGEAEGAALPPRGKQKPIAPSKDTPLNPLRAGQAAAGRIRNAVGASDAESAEVVDGGGAPKLPKISGKGNASRANAPRQRGRKK